MKKNKQTVALPQSIFLEKYMHIILCVLAFILYANTLGNGYNMDDELVTRKHKLASKGISAIPKIFTSPYYSDNMGYFYEYRPVVLSSFAIEHQFFGDNPVVSHFFNMLLYILTALILFKLLRTLLQGHSYWISVIAVLLFIFHPLHTETVASIKNRDEILALMSALGAWWFAIKYIQNGKYWNVPVIFLLFLSGLFSKTSIAPLMILIPISLVLFLQASGRKVFVVTITLAVAVTIMGYISFTFTTDYLYALLLLVFLPYAIWLLYHEKHRIIFSTFKNILSKGWSDVKENNSTTIITGDSYKLTRLQIDFKEIVNISFSIQSAVFFVLLFISVYTANQLWSILAFVYFPFLFYRSTDSQKNILMIIFSAGFSLFSLYFVKPDFPVLGAQFIFFAYIMYKPLRNIFAIIAYFILLVVCVYLKSESGFLLSSIGFLICIFSDKNKFTRIVAKIAIGLTLLACAQNVFYIVTLTPGYREDVYILLVNLLFIGLLLRYRLKSILMVLLVVIIPFIVVFNLDSTPISDFTQKQQSYIDIRKDTYDKRETVSKPFFESERPIAFAEIPVDKTSPMEERLGMASTVMGFYLKKMVVPYPMGYYYGYAFFKPVSIFEFVPIVYLVIHILLLVLALAIIKRHRVISFGILFYIISMALFSGFIYPVVGVAGDRFTYTASLGFSLVVAYLLVYFVMREKTADKIVAPSRSITVVLSVLILCYGFITVSRNALWRHPLELMGNDIEYLDESAQAHNLYGLNLMRESMENKKLKSSDREQMRRTAVQQFDKALQIWPNFFNAAYDKGRASLMIGDYSSAIAGYEQAVSIGPEEGFIEPYIQLSQLYLQVGRYKEFLKNAQKLLTLKNEAESYNMVARGFYLTGKSDSAKTYLRRAMVLYPTDMSLRKNMAEIFKVESQMDSLNFYAR